MRSFQHVVVFLFALLTCAFAQSSGGYDATVYITSTVYRVNTVYKSGSAPSIVSSLVPSIIPSIVSSSVANQTSTVAATRPTYGAGNATAIIAPTGSQAKPSQPQFTGAASSLHANAFLAALAAGVGYLVL